MDEQQRRLAEIAGQGYTILPDAMSREIGAYYRARRSVPPRNVCTSASRNVVRFDL